MHRRHRPADDPLDGRRPHLPLAPDRRHRQVQGLRGDGARHRGLGRRDRHRRRAPGEPLRPQPADAGRLRRSQDATPTCPTPPAATPPTDAVRTLRLAREAGGWNLVKLEVLGDQKTLYPDMDETLAAAEALITDGFEVMVYCTDDPILAKRLEEIGCVAIMPLAAPDRLGPRHPEPVNIRLIVEQAKVPVLVDAGVGTASDAAVAMELGCDGVLMNTAIAEAKDPIRMARAMKHAVDAGRLGLSRRADAEEALRRSVVAAGRPDLRRSRLRPGTCLLARRLAADAARRRQARCRLRKELQSPETDVRISGGPATSSRRLALTVGLASLRPPLARGLL